MTADPVRLPDPEPEAPRAHWWGTALSAIAFLGMLAALLWLIGPIPFS